MSWALLLIFWPIPMGSLFGSDIPWPCGPLTCVVGLEIPRTRGLQKPLSEADEQLGGTMVGRSRSRCHLKEVTLQDNILFGIFSGCLRSWFPVSSIGQRLCCQNVVKNAGRVMDSQDKVAMKSAWGEAKAEETMTSYSNTFLLFSIFLRPHLCQDDSMEKQRIKLDLLIGIMCLFMVLLIFLIVGCLLLHFRLFSEDMLLKEDLKSYTIQTHCVETKIVLAPSQTDQLASSGWMAIEKPTGTECKTRSSTPPELTPSCKNATSHMSQSHSSESLHSDETGSIYSLEFFTDLCSSSWSDSKESLVSRNSQEEDGEGSTESGSTILCTIHPM